jgi:hypothetical protein
MTSPDEGIEVARIEITRVLTPEGQDTTWCAATDSQGDPLPLVEALGLLRMAEDTVIRQSMGEGE